MLRAGNGPSRVVPPCPDVMLPQFVLHAGLQVVSLASAAPAAFPTFRVDCALIRACRLGAALQSVLVCATVLQLQARLARTRKGSCTEILSNKADKGTNSGGQREKCAMRAQYEIQRQAGTRGTRLGSRNRDKSISAQLSLQAFVQGGRIGATGRDRSVVAGLPLANTLLRPRLRGMSCARGYAHIMLAKLAGGKC